MDKDEMNDLPDEAAESQQAGTEKEDVLSGFLEGIKSMTADQQQVMREMAETIKSFRPPEKKEEKKDDFVLPDFLPEDMDELIKNDGLSDAFATKLKKGFGAIAEQNGALKKMYAIIQDQQARLAKAEEIAQRSFETAEISSIGQDVWKTVNSKEFNTWMDGLSPTKKRLYSEIRKSGTREEVAEMEQEYRAATKQVGKQGQSGQQGRPEVNQRQRGGVTMDSFAAPERESDGNEAEGYNLDDTRAVKDLFGYMLKKHNGDSQAAALAVKNAVRKRMEGSR